MKYKMLKFVLVECILLVAPRFVKAEPTAGVLCKCEVVSCGPCESEVDVKFYSAKCGENLERVKSCKKPVCEAVPNQDQCFAELGMDKKAERIATSAGEAKPSARAPSSEPRSGYTEIGKVDAVMGHASVFRDNQSVKIVASDMKIFENDRITTDSGARVKIIFNQSNDEIHVIPNSNVFIQKFMHQGDNEEHDEYKKTIVKLDFGKIRIRLSKDGEKYDHEKNIFEVKTKTAVAGVRGTDFVMSYDENTKISEVATLSGAVEMSAQNAGESSGSAAFVSAGESCRTTVNLDFSELSGVKKLDAKTLKLLDSATEVQKLSSHTKKPVEEGSTQRDAKNSSICHLPAADFKECAWFCEGNPAHEKKCRVDLKDVNCVRKMCGANGTWISPTRMPSSESDRCDGAVPVKQPCGNFW